MAMFDPCRKISETLLHFAAPLLFDLSSEEAERKTRQALSVSFTTWNAVVFADVLKDPSYLDEIRLVTAGKSEIADLIEQMITRKRTFFAHDERLIGTWEVTLTDDGINVRADARDPYSLRRDPSSRTEDPGRQRWK